MMLHHDRTSRGPLRVDVEGQGGRCRIVMDEPPGNLLSLNMVRSLRAQIHALPFDGSLKLITIEGAGKDFSFGARIQEHVPEEIRRVLPEAHHLIRDLLHAPAMTAAIVRGRCLGGGFELALACDLIFAASDATFGLPEIALGAFPPAACALLPARVGTARTTGAIVTGLPRTARQWQSAGLIERVAVSEALEREVERWFEAHLRPRSAEALRHAIRASRLAVIAQIEPVLAEAERLYLDDLMRTSDAIEGVAAFLDKRPPKWTDS